MLHQIPFAFAGFLILDQLASALYLDYYIRLVSLLFHIDWMYFLQVNKKRQREMIFTEKKLTSFNLSIMIPVKKIVSVTRQYSFLSCSQ